MSRRGLVTILLGAILLAPPVLGQDGANLRGDSPQTRKRLVEAEQKLLAGKPADAADDLQRVIDEAGDDLITTDGKEYRPARWLAHGILARLPESALRNYQDRIDNPARKLLAQAKRTNDPAPLWELLDRYFVSRATDEGLLLLGDLLFERGEFRQAEQTWQRLVPDGTGEIAYPGSRIDQATIRARIILAMIFQHDLDRAGRELILFHKRYPDARGHLAGKTGVFAETLQGFLDRPPSLSPPANDGTGWPSFGGGPDRSGRVAARLSGQWPSRPSWEMGLRTVRRAEAAPQVPPRRPPYGHPVIAQGFVFVSDGWHLQGFHLLTGQPTSILRLDNPPDPRERRDPYPKADPDPCPTLSAEGDRLYVRIGPGVIKPVQDPKDLPTAIACIRVILHPDGPCTLKELWRVGPPTVEDGTPAFWEGAPIASARRMWAAYGRFEGGRLVHGIACYDPNDSSSTPDRPVWTADVCEGSVTGTDGRARHELLTLTGRRVVFCSNSGAVIALDAATGRRAWGFRYTRSRQPDLAQSSYPTPVVSSGGRLFVAPADGDAIYALESERGRLLWQSGSLTGARILGVSAGRVIVSVDGPVKGIRALSMETGQFLPPGGWNQHDGGGILGYGQGFVTDDVIVWPTRSGLLFLRSVDGVPLGDSRPSPLTNSNANYFGNVIYGDGVLVVVGPVTLWGYISHQREYGPARGHSGREPARPEFETLIDQTERALSRGDSATARQLLLNAASGRLPNPYRAWAVARLLHLTPTGVGEPPLPQELEAALSPDICEQWLFGPDGLPVTLGALIERHMGRSDRQRKSSSTLSCSRREPPERPKIHSGSDVTRTLRLPPGCSPLMPILGAPPRSQNLLVATDTQLIALSLGTGEMTRFAAPDLLTSAAELGQGFVAVGPTTVAIYGDDRSPRWVFRIPTTEQLPPRPGTPFLFLGEAPRVPELTSVRLHGSWLFARLGERHFIAVDLAARRIAWLIGSDGSPGYRPATLANASQFGPSYVITGRYLVVQLSDGRRWLLEAETGRTAAITNPVKGTAKTWWTQDPPEIEQNTVAIADGAGLLRLVDLATGADRWNLEVEGEASLTGEPPQVAVRRNALFIAVRRNHGVEIDRIDVRDGQSLWTGGPVFLDADRVQLAHADADSERVVVPAGNRLVAISVETGRILWQTELPRGHETGGWVVLFGSECVVAYPLAAVPREPVRDVLTRLSRSFAREPALWRLPMLLAAAYDAWVERSVPVVILEPETGQRLVRFDIPARGPAVTVRFERDLAVIATGDRVVWLR